MVVFAGFVVTPFLWLDKNNRSIYRCLALQPQRAENLR
jgi:hypothetical protein